MQQRLTRYGPNELAEKQTNPVLKFPGYFWGAIPWMIEVAVILSVVDRHCRTFFSVGFRAGHQAGNAIAALEARLAIRARVKREGRHDEKRTGQ